MYLESRDVYRRADLVRLIEPRSIAVVGASANQKSFGSRTVAGLQSFDGSLYLVNANYTELGNEPCYPSVSALPEVPDCVVVATPGGAVEQIVKECASIGVGGAILYASGYAETGMQDALDAQARLTAISRASGMRILGPNCIGFLNTSGGRSLTFMGDLSVPAPEGPAIGIVSQSGAIGLGLGQGARLGTQISHILNAGNSCDVDVADLVNYLVDDDSCAAIACVFEGMAQPERFLEAARRAWQADKPLVVCKLATSERGAASAMSHTGSLSGTDAAYRAAFRRYGVVMVHHLDALAETAAFFSKASRPSARGTAVVAASGGLAIIGADAAENHKVPLPAPDAKVAQVLAQHVPDFGAAGNPCDVTAQVTNNPESLLACAGAFMSSPAYGALVLPIHYAYEAIPDRVALASKIGRQYNKPVCIAWGNGWLGGPGFEEAARSRDTSLFRSMDRCFETLALWHEREALRSEGVRVEMRIAPEHAADDTELILEKSQTAALTESQAKRVLSHYGVRVVGERLVNTVQEALSAATDFGFPVAMKAESPDILHKTEADVIRLNIENPSRLHAAFDEILSNVGCISPAPRLNGVLVQPMVPAGVEVMVGARIDPLFGPLIMVALGGVFVELIKDTVVGLAPVTQPEALAMLRRLKGYATLTGFRGSEPVDLDALAETICRISELAADQRHGIEELDVNPLICAGDVVIAVDALIVKKAVHA